VLKGVIFQDFRATGGDIIQFILWVCAFEFPMFYNHHNHKGNVIVIPFTMEAHQGDPLGRALFALAHFKALHSIANHFYSCLLPSIIDNIHIIGPTSIISSTSKHF